VEKALKKRLGSFIGVTLWVIFVHIIAPDLSWWRSFLAGLIGLLAVIFLAAPAPLLFESISGKGEAENVEGE
jgi:hypothetical protein